MYEEALAHWGLSRQKNKQKYVTSSCIINGNELSVSAMRANSLKVVYVLFIYGSIMKAVDITRYIALNGDYFLRMWKIKAWRD